MKDIISNFKVDGTFIHYERFGCGHINDTYAVYFKSATKHPFRYILQRINDEVFSSPEEVMNNIYLVTSFLHDKIKKNGGNPYRESLTIIKTIDDKLFYIDKESKYWRMYIFIDDAESYQNVEKPEDFYCSGKAFGVFQNYLSDFDASKLFITIKNFHNTPVRYNNLLKAIKKNPMGRVEKVQKEIDFCAKRINDINYLQNLLDKNKLPLRVTHNDTKLNNVMIDNTTGEGICVIDLDTVMPGLSLYDFGDSIRFGANVAAEDEIDLSLVNLDLNLFEHFAKGYLSEAKENLTPLEIENLAFGSKIMTLECGIRFLTDYINGDTYFKIHREKHNLDRARTQLKLVEDMENKMDAMNEIIKNNI